VKGLVVVRRFYFARAAILAHVAGFGKYVVPLFGFWMGHGFIVRGPQLMQGLRKNRRLWRDRNFVGVIFHKLILRGRPAVVWLNTVIRSHCGN